MLVGVDYSRDAAGLLTCRGMDPLCADIWLDCVDKLKADFTFSIKVTAKGGTIEKKYAFKAGTKRDAVLRQMLKSFQRPLNGKEFWPVYEDWGKHILQIQGFIKDGKFFIVEELEVRRPEMEADKQPPVRLPNKEWNRSPSEDR